MEVYEKMKTDFACVVVGTLIIAAIIYQFDLFKDATDGETRSGMSLHVDHETGLHYLGRPGVLIPRMNSDGNQMRESENSNAVRPNSWLTWRNGTRSVRRHLNGESPP